VHGAAGTNASAVGFDKLSDASVLYQGLSILGSGAILGGLILGAITAFMIEKQFVKAAAFAFSGAVLTFFGLMHSQAIGVNQTPLVTLSYVNGWCGTDGLCEVCNREGINAAHTCRRR